jgi:hypothetical protein
MYFSHRDTKLPLSRGQFGFGLLYSDKPQDIVFILPQDVIPNYIRIGLNQWEAKEISIQNF